MHRILCHTLYNKIKFSDRVYLLIVDITVQIVISNKCFIDIVKVSVFNSVSSINSAFIISMKGAVENNRISKLTTLET